MIFRHYFVNAGRIFDLEPQVAVRNNADQFASFAHDRDAAHMIFAHQRRRVFHGPVRTKGDRLGDHSRFGTLHPVNHFRLPVKRKVLVKNPDAAFARQSNRHIGFRDGIHRGAHDGNIERDTPREARAHVRIARENI